MGSAERVEIDLAPWPLLALRPHIREIRATKPDVWLQTAPDGPGGNWIFGDAERSAAEPRWRVDRLWLDDGRLRFTDAAEKTDIDVRLGSVSPAKGARDAGAPVAVAGKGHWRGAAFRMEGQVASPLDLADTDTPYRVDLDARAGATRARARGTLTNPFRFRTFDLRMALSGRDLEDLYPLLGLALPPSPPYALDGRLRRNGDLWRYEGFTGKVGDSDLGGDVQVDAAKREDAPIGLLNVPQLDQAFRHGLLRHGPEGARAPPGSQAGPATSAAPRWQASPRPRSCRL